MTSGQNGPEDGGRPGETPGQAGSPPGWNAPPQQPYGRPSGQPPQPYGQPHGYAPAPSAPGYGAPTPLERPITVRAGLGAFLGSLVLSVISTVVTFLNWPTITAALLARLHQELGSGADLQGAQAGAELGARLGVAFGLVLAAVYALFVWFAWRGQNWARVVLWVLGGLGVLGGLAGLATGGSPLPFLTGLSFFQVLLLLAAIVLLALKPSNDWFRYRRWLRVTGQGR
jgi:hypothetical protein